MLGEGLCSAAEILECLTDETFYIYLGVLLFFIECTSLMIIPILEKELWSSPFLNVN